MHDLVVEVATAGETYAMDVPASVEETRAFWSGDHVVVAVDGDTVLGSAKMGPNRPAQGCPRRHGLVHGRLRGPRSRHRPGAGGARRRLAPRPTASTAIQFNAVVSTNTAAVRLWQSLGFEIVGTVPGRPSGCPTASYADLHVMYLGAGRPMRLEELRRYPVKAMAGESLESVVVDGRGLDGDRWFAVWDEDGQDGHR